MSGPFIFIATNRLNPGMLDGETARVPGLVDFVHAHEPRVIAFNEYVNGEATEVAVVQFHPDSASLEFHMGVIAERAAPGIRVQRRLREIEPRRMRDVLGRDAEHLFGNYEEVAEAEVLDRHSASRSRTCWFCSITARTRARNALSVRFVATRSAIACRISTRPGCGVRRRRLSGLRRTRDQARRAERATGIEPAFSAWETHRAVMGGRHRT